MPTLDSSLKTLILAVLVAAVGAAFAQGDDQWYGGQSTGFWGLNNSVGVRGSLPGTFNPPGTNPESLNAQRQYGGYRISNAFAIEGSQTQFGSNSSGCNGDPGTGDANHSCYGSAWSLSGVATLPLQSGLSLYGRLGLHYWQKGYQDESNGHRNVDEPGGIGKVYGVGLSYGLTKSITVHAESERYSELIGNSASGPGLGLGLDSSVHSIGLSIKF
ncbi:MAG TPA: outer membrane beta-barrel protein [Burkholderiales bacterium]